ncbi:SMI1/KNR4 family protein [Clostridium botulinum]|uniref:SMI1/KNR4 family protein n=1 Tax=Clostridium sp. ZBS13 TaxID=2949971 RepID=UPI001DFD4F7E|nr:SMI1/KNR4 family protein [Clostridium sp. ZBS13]MBN1046992.1 SMI1/KNR4 family protein [Clostridium botulinum]
MNNKFKCTRKGCKININAIEKVEKELEIIFPKAYKEYIITLVKVWCLALVKM